MPARPASVQDRPYDVVQDRPYTRHSATLQYPAIAHFVPGATSHCFRPVAEALPGGTARDTMAALPATRAQATRAETADEMVETLSAKVKELRTAGLDGLHEVAKDSLLTEIEEAQHLVNRWVAPVSSESPRVFLVEGERQCVKRKLRELHSQAQNLEASPRGPRPPRLEVCMTLLAVALVAVFAVGLHEPTRAAVVDQLGEISGWKAQLATIDAQHTTAAAARDEALQQMSEAVAAQMIAEQEAAEVELLRKELEAAVERRINGEWIQGMKLVLGREEREAAAAAEKAVQERKEAVAAKATADATPVEEDGRGGGVFEAMVGLFLILGMVLVLALLVMLLVMVMAMMLAMVLVMVLGMVLVLLKNLYRIC